MMKPILFNTEMVRAILDGRKTVTRRLVNPQPLWIEQDKKYRTCPSGWWWGLDRIKAIEDSQLFAQMLAAECAPYRVCDILYVRETWCKDAGRYLYRANYSDNEKFYMNGQEVDIKWRPSIHMPREAARIWLRVTDVRVERLQEITMQDIRREGSVPSCAMCSFNEAKSAHGIECRKAIERSADCPLENPFPNCGFRGLWDSTIKPADRERYGWAANPWVWAIAFERCEKPKEAKP